MERFFLLVAGLIIKNEFKMVLLNQGYLIVTQSNFHHMSLKAKYFFIWEEICRSEDFDKMGSNNLFQLNTTMIT